MDQFVFVVCQHGAEIPLKAQALATGSWRLAFSRPGLLTLKRDPERHQDGDEAWLSSPLVRLAGSGLGSVKAEVAQTGFEKLWQLATEKAGGGFDAIHIFERDRTLPGAYSFEPGVSELASTLGAELASWLAAHEVKLPINQNANPGQRVLDIVLSEPNQWFVGQHTVGATHERWPGGAAPVIAPPEMVSRAYLKLAEALMWGQLPMASGDRVVEIGSAPGGASQRLLDLGYQVTGIDAAEMDERVLEHPRFEHWRSKAAAVRRRMYHKFKWLVCDANVAPNYTLDIIGDIVNYDGNHIQGMVLTFKLSAWEQLEHLDQQLEAIRQMGFGHVQARQLAHNRRELCVVAKR